MANLRGFVEYGKLECDDRAAEICFQAALSFAEHAGLPEGRFVGNALYDLLVYGVALKEYENRGFSPAIAVNSFVQNSWVTAQVTALKKMLEYGKTGGCVCE